jgi:hypothetical protein
MAFAIQVISRVGFYGYAWPGGPRSGGIFLGGGFSYDASQDREAKSPVEQILRAGQASGEFRDFDVTVMATMIQRAVDGLPFLLTDDPDFDTRTYAAEVITAFELATRAAP